MANFTFRCEREDISNIHNVANKCGYKVYGYGGATKFVHDALNGLSKLLEDDEQEFMRLAEKYNFKK